MGALESLEVDMQQASSVDNEAATLDFLWMILN